MMIPILVAMIVNIMVFPRLLFSICECVYIHTSRYMHMIDKLIWKSSYSSLTVNLGEIPGNGIIGSQVVSSYVNRVTSPN